MSSNLVYNTFFSVESTCKYFISSHGNSISILLKVPKLSQVDQPWPVAVWWQRQVCEYTLSQMSFTQSMQESIHTVLGPCYIDGKLYFN